MEGPYTVLSRVADRLKLQIESIPKPIDIKRTKEILTPVHDVIMEIMGKDNGKLFLHDPSVYPPVASAMFTPPRGKRLRTGESKPPVLPDGASPLPAGIFKDSPLPKGGKRRTRKQRKSKH